MPEASGASIRRVGMPSWIDEVASPQEGRGRADLASGGVSRERQGSDGCRLNRNVDVMLPLWSRLLGCAVRVGGRVVPAQHSQRPEGVPPAGRAVRFLEAEV